MTEPLAPRLARLGAAQYSMESKGLVADAVIALHELDEARAVIAEAKRIAHNIVIQGSDPAQVTLNRLNYLLDHPTRETLRMDTYAEFAEQRESTPLERYEEYRKDATLLGYTPMPFEKFAQQELLKPTPLERPLTPQEGYEQYRKNTPHILQVGFDQWESSQAYTQYFIEARRTGEPVLPFPEWAKRREQAEAVVDRILTSAKERDTAKAGDRFVRRNIDGTVTPFVAVEGKGIVPDPEGKD